MSRDPRALIIERLAVRRMPGIVDRGYELTGLAAGINIIHGPNASGKTTTARALESVLWPRGVAPSRAILGARFHLDGREWSVEVEGQRAEYQQGGHEASPPALPPAEARDRYHLSLHELLSAENRAFADEIVRESAGGYDLAGAAAALQIRQTASRWGKEAEALKEARARLREAYAAEDALQQEERRLAELSANLEEARAAARRVRLLERAVEYVESAAAEAEAIAAVTAFPEELGLLRGDEADRLAEIRDQLAEAERRFNAAEEARLEAESALRSAGLPAEGVDDEVLDALRARLTSLRALEQEIAAKERDLGGARRTSAEELRRIGEVADEATLRGLDLVALDELAGFAEEAGKVRAALQAAEARLTHLAPGADRVEFDRAEFERLGKGALLLQQWLRAGNGAGPEAAGHERRLRTLGALAAGLLAGAGLVALILGAAAPAVAIALTLVGGLILSLILRPAVPAADPREGYRREYERLGLESPRSWTAEEVASTLDRLESLRAAARLAEERARERERVEAELEAARAEWAALEERRRRLTTTYGVAPELDPATFYLLANRINRWQEAERLVIERTAELEHLHGERRAALAGAAELLAPFRFVANGSADLAGVDDLAGAIEGLARRVERHRLAMADLRHAKSRADGARREIDALIAERRAIFERLGLSGDEGDPESLIRDWCRLHHAYGEAVKARQGAEAIRRGAYERLVGSDGYEQGLEDRDPDELRAELEDAARLAASAEELGREIAEIEARLKVAREGHAVEDALVEVERCEAALREVRDRDILGVVGHALVDYLQRATRDTHRPAVFIRARELFTQITRGRYRLDFDDGATPAFRAIDTETGRGHALDELSSGTRVQLLLAVRLAFVESQETGVRLPLIFDETLGNSDEDRARAIMEATIALAAEGRQVFYFTAQPDEVGKWRGLLEAGGNGGVEWAVIDLAEVRKLARHEAAPLLPMVAAPDREPPSPAGMSHDEYGRILLVPALDLFGDPAGVHLWHLMEDPELLYRLLTRRLESWGALRALVEYGGGALLGEDMGMYPRIEAAARALEVTLELARIGRGRPVDRDTIEASGAVTDTFMPRVIDLLARVGGDGARLIEAIEGGALKGFLKSRRERLREYFEEHGYLDPREPVAPDELRARVVAEIAREIAAGQVELRLVERIIQRVVTL